MQSHGDKAEFGGVTGGVVNMTSKSGSNRFRGSVFGFFRNDSLVARDPYRDVVGGVAKAPPEFQQSQFGVNIGGPIIKDKTFFFASYDGWRYRENARLRYIVPATDAWLNGDFSLAFSRTIYNPYTTRVVNGRTVRDPFPGNIIPAEPDLAHDAGVPAQPTWCGPTSPGARSSTTSTTWTSASRRTTRTRSR